MGVGVTADIHTRAARRCAALDGLVRICRAELYLEEAKKAVTPQQESLQAYCAVPRQLRLSRQDSRGRLTPSQSADWVKLPNSSRLCSLSNFARPGACEPSPEAAPSAFGYGVTGEDDRSDRFMIRRPDQA